MKKFLYVLFAVVLILSSSACGTISDSQSNETGSSEAHAESKTEVYT